MPQPETSHQIIIGDARRMRLVGDESVQLVVTSPPYWQLKDYGNARQIGFNDSYETYINHLNLVWAECHRVLENGCRLCINIGDQFARAAYYGRYKVIPIKTEIIRFCEHVGFDFMGAIIWQKTTTSNASGGGSVMGSFPYPRNGIVKLDYESILLFKKTGAPNRRTIPKSIKEASRLTTEEWNTYFSGHWNFAGVRQDKHLAMFPDELPKRLIKMFSYRGETVLDPFLGSGTTSLNAGNLSRHSIGYEINPDYKKIIRRKLGGNQDLLNTMKIKFKEDEATKTDFQNAINDLPYRFCDPVKIIRKVNPKNQTFGSKIDGNEQRKNDTYRIHKIINTDKLILNGDMGIRLLGITPLKEKASDAVSFIHTKTKGQKVFLRFDEEKYDADGNLFCYLYLTNKTFINAHLIKDGYAIADRSINHRHLKRFIEYQEAKNG